MKREGTQTVGSAHARQGAVPPAPPLVFLRAPRKEKKDRGEGDSVPFRGVGRSPTVWMLLLFLLLFAGPASALEVREYDLVVFGAGTGGMAAAIHASREGLSVAVVEESDRVGGQMVGAAVSTMDDVGRTRTGLYLEFIERVRDHYAQYGTATNICLWGGDTIAVEPLVAERILLEMWEEELPLPIYREARIERVDVRDGRVQSVLVSSDRYYDDLLFSADVFIDATERGDLLAQAGARYRVGNSISPNVDLSANVQDITYVAVVKRYPAGLPDSLRMPGPPPGYERYVEKFRSIVTRDGDTWPGSYPFDIPSHNAYRALPDTTNEHLIVGDDASTWRFISRTGINWANDYPGRKSDRPGLPVRFIEDDEYRKQVEREAMHKTLCFVWYMQSELGMTDWSVDDGQGYGGYFSNDWQRADDPLLPAEFAPILSCFPPFPYVREGRRLVGIESLSDADIKRDPARGRAVKNYPTSLALGEYPVDVHGSHLDRYMEHDLGETTESFPKTWAGSQGVFPVPFGVFVPETIDGLIAAEKNLSVSRMVNGAIRLHPITMHTGQTAGAIAVEAVRSGAQPREVNVGSVQRALMAAGCYIALDKYEDVADPRSSLWTPVQWASLNEAMGGFSRRYFAAEMPITREQLARLLETAFDQGLPSHSAIGLLFPGDERFIAKGDFVRMIDALLGVDATAIIGNEDMTFTLKRGDALFLIHHLLSESTLR